MQKTLIMKAPKKKSQCQRLLAYLKKNRKGITTMEAFRELGITCVHKRIAELEQTREFMEFGGLDMLRIKERTATGSTVTRYKLDR